MTISRSPPCKRGGWHDPEGKPPGERDVSWIVSEVVCRGEAYGLIERHPRDGQARHRRSQLVLTAATRDALGIYSEPRGNESPHRVSATVAETSVQDPQNTAIRSPAIRSRTTLNIQ